MSHFDKSSHLYTLTLGAVYEIKKDNDNSTARNPIVTLLDYTSSPEMIIVRTNSGQIHRISRSDLICFIRGPSAT